MAKRLVLLVSILMALSFAQDGTISYPVLSESDIDFGDEGSWVLPYSQAVYRGQQLHDQGFYEEAIQAYQDAVQLIPEPKPKDLLASLYFEISLSFSAQEKNDSALIYGKKSIQTDDMDQAYSLLGDLYDKLNNIDSALFYYNAGIEKFPQSHWLLYNKSVALDKAGRMDEAYETILKSIQSTTDHEGSYFEAAYLAFRKAYWIDFFANGTYSRVVGESKDRHELFIDEMVAIYKGTIKQRTGLYFTPYVHDSWLMITEHDFQKEIFDGDSIKEKYKDNDYEILLSFMTIALQKAVYQGYNFRLKPLYRKIVDEGLAEPYIRLVLRQTFEIEFNVWAQNNKKELNDLVDLLAEFYKSM